MDAKQIARMGRRLCSFLGLFRDCFGRSEPRDHLEQYVRGQLSDLQRKSVEPIALAAGTPPRTLQRFVEMVTWDEERMCDRLQQIVAREHADPQPSEPSMKRAIQRRGDIRRPSIGSIAATLARSTTVS